MKDSSAGMRSNGRRKGGTCASTGRMVVPAAAVVVLCCLAVFWSAPTWASDWQDGFNGGVGNWTLRAGTAMTYSTAANHGTYTGAGSMAHSLNSSEMYRSTGSRPYHAGKVTGYFYDTQMYRPGVCGNTYRQLLGFAASTYTTYQLSVGLYSAGGAGNYYRRDSGSSYTSMGARGAPAACSTPGWVTYIVEFQGNGNCYRYADDGYISPLTSTVARSQAVIDAGIGMVTAGLGASSANQGYWDDIAWDGYDPGTPTSLAATANSTSQITWTANAATDNNQYGFALMNGTTEEEVSSTTTRATSASFVRTGLSANTAYTRGIRAWNGDNNSATATAITRYTLQNTPTAPTFGTITVNSIVLNTTDPVNLTGTSGVYFDSTTTGGDGGINGWVQALTDTATGLSPNTQYTFQAKARNGESVETAYSGTASKYTLQNAATTPTVTAPSTTQLDLTTTGPVNLTSGSSGVIFKRDGSADLTKVQALTGSDTGLGVNTMHTYTARGVNGDGTATAESGSSTGVYTLQNTPAAPTFGTITVNSIVLNVTGPANETAGTSGVYFDSTTTGGDGGINAWVQALTDTATGLAANTEYTFQAKARNGNAVETGYSGTASAWTLSAAPTAGSVTPNEPNPCVDGTVTWTAVGGFGAGKIQKYKYVWDQNATHDWDESESDWSTGTVQTSATAAGTWYLHVKGYNGAGVANGTHDYAVTTISLASTPTDGTPTSSATTSVTWNWDAVSGATGYRVRDTGGVQKGSDVLAPTTTMTESSGIAANVQYTRKISAYNGCGESAGSTGQTKYSLQVTPATPTFGTISLDSIELSTTGPVNLTGNSGVYFDSTTTGGDGGLNEWVQVNADTASGLSPNTQYTFQAKARNGDSEETSYSATASKYTLQNAASTPTVTAVSTSELEVTTTGPVNLGAGSSGVIFKRDATTDLSAVRALTGSDTGLSANTLHTYTARGVNGDGTETDESGSSTGVYTLQNTPAAPTFSNVGETSVRVTTTGPANLTAGSSGVIFHDGSADRTKVTELYEDVTGLAANTEYTFKAKGVNGDGVPTGYGSTASTWTLSAPPGVGSVTPNKPNPCANDPVTWTAAGFGPGKVAKYKYVWDQNPTHTWSESEDDWSSGTIQTLPTGTGSWYLHVKGYNGANVANGAYDYAVSIALPSVGGTTSTTP